jgi:hypothetical protein
MPEIGTSGLMSGDGKRGDGHRPQATAPILDSTMCDIDPAAASDPAIGGGENLSRWVSGKIRRPPRQLLHPHQWLRKMVAHRIADPTILEVIGKWLKAEGMVDGALSKKIGNSIAGSKIVTKGPCSLGIASVSRRSAPARSRAAQA